MPERLDLAIGDRRVVLGRVVQVIVLGNGGTARRFLVDIGHGGDRLQHGIAFQRLVPAQRAGLAVVAGFGAPAVGVGQVHIAAPAVAPCRVAACRHDALPAVLAGLCAHLGFRFQRRRARQHVDHAADRIRTVERGARPLADLDAARHRHIDLIQGVMVEKTGGTGGDAILAVKVYRAGGQGLADCGLMAFAAGDVDPHARHLPHHL